VADLDWLIRPIAHRGLHDTVNGLIENTPSAVEAAIEAGYAVEVDVQPAGDGQVMVFHDAALDRLTRGRGTVIEHSAAELKRLAFKGTSDRMQTLPELLEQVSGRVPLVIEIKSDWGERGAFEKMLASCLQPYKGLAAVMSFDPNATAAFGDAAPQRPRGLVAGSFRNPHYWGHLSPQRRFVMRHLLSAFVAKPHFVAYDIETLSAAAPWVWRSVLRRPLLTWTVKSNAQRERARRCADAMIFEGFRP